MNNPSTDPENTQSSISGFDDAQLVRLQIELTDDPSTYAGINGRRFAIFSPGTKPKIGWYVVIVPAPGEPPTVRIFRLDDDGSQLFVPLNKEFPAEKLSDPEILGSVISLNVQTN